MENIQNRVVQDMTYNNCFTLGCKSKKEDGSYKKIPAYIDQNGTPMKLYGGKGDKLRRFYELPYEQAKELENGLTDILISRNEFAGFRVTGTGTHSGTEGTATPTRTSSTRKYICPCCGNSVRATKEVHIACLDCGVPMVLAG